MREDSKPKNPTKNPQRNETTTNKKNLQTTFFFKKNSALLLSVTVVAEVGNRTNHIMVV